MDEARKRNLFAVADRLHADGMRVSLRNLIPLLAAGGSNREVGPVLREWKAKRGYAPALKVKALPFPLQAALAKVAGEFWAAAQSEAAAALTRDRANMAATLRAHDDVLADALDRLDEAEGRIAEMRGELERAAGRLDDAEARLERKRSEEFWDRVMREVYEILPATGTMTAAQLLRLLKPATIRGAVDRQEPMTPRTLHKKMTMRVSHGWYFKRDETGFSRGKVPTIYGKEAASPA
ncbi:DNA-binding protein [Methylobacterium mesophilicum]